MKDKASLKSYVEANNFTIGSEVLEKLEALGYPLPTEAAATSDELQLLYKNQEGRLLLVVEPSGATHGSYCLKKTGEFFGKTFDSFLEIDSMKQEDWVKI